MVRFTGKQRWRGRREEVSEEKAKVGGKWERKGKQGTADVEDEEGRKKG